MQESKEVCNIQPGPSPAGDTGDTDELALRRRLLPAGRSEIIYNGRIRHTDTTTTFTRTWGRSTEDDWKMNNDKIRQENTG